MTLFWDHQPPVAPSRPPAPAKEATPTVNAPNRRLVRTLCVLAGAGGAVTLALAVALSSPSGLVHVWPAILLCLAIAGLQVAPVSVTHEGQREALYLEEAFVVPMALYLGVGEGLAVLAVAVLVGQVWHRRGLLKGAFNVGALVMAAGAGLAVSRLLGASVGDLGNRSLLAAAVGGLVYAVASMLMVAGIITTAQRGRYLDTVLDGYMVRIVIWAASLAVGMLLAVAIDGRLWFLPLMAAPVALFQIACDRAFAQFNERHRIEGLYDAAASIRSSMDSRQVVAQLLACSQRLLDASDARLVTTGAPEVPGALRAAVDETFAVEISSRQAGGPWRENDEGLLRTLASVAASALGNANLFERLRAVTASLAEGVVALDEEGIVTFANPAAERMLGLEQSGLLHRSLHAVVHARPGAQRDDVHECRLGALLAAGGTARDDDDVFVRADGTRLPVAVTTSPVTGDGGSGGTVMAFRDITERKAFEQELSHRMFYDGLTGLPNRALFADRLRQAHVRATRSRAPYAVLLIDLDRFKVVNDSLGHQAGDELLVAVSERLQPDVRPGDTFARSGGDEFVMLLEELVREDDAVLVAQRALEDLGPPFRIQGRDVRVTASIGIVVAHPAHTTPEDALRDAEVAMYRAKASGKGRYELARPGDKGELGRLDREIALRLAIDRGELEVFYQPVVSLEQRSVAGVEALVRWRHPTRGLVQPDEFIALAEETGLILPLGRWVLEEACRQLQAWTAASPDLASLVVAVNLSPHQFAQEGLCDQVAEVLAATGLEPGRLCLEVTETALMADAASTTVTVSRLKSLGARLSIDDFGTGYSSLSYLKRFPVDYVKIDRSFMSGLGEEGVDAEIVRSVIRLAKAIGIGAVAEGVEDEHQLRQLHEMGCPLVQGYLLARPQPAADIQALLRRPLALPHLTTRF
ncbi:MAG TPA: EAL domain-containing protein [Acidimicrobiales bacterium]|nr:EAL domain-containing protein [Acidimicrobiales bacterium]